MGSVLAKFTESWLDGGFLSSVLRESSPPGTARAVRKVLDRRSAAGEAPLNGTPRRAWPEVNGVPGSARGFTDRRGWAVGARAGWSLGLGPVIGGNPWPDLRPLFASLTPPSVPGPARHHAQPRLPQPCRTPVRGPFRSQLTSDCVLAAPLPPCRRRPTPASSSYPDLRWGWPPVFSTLRGPTTPQGLAAPPTVVCPRLEVPPPPWGRLSHTQPVRRARRLSLVCGGQSPRHRWFPIGVAGTL